MLPNALPDQIAMSTSALPGPQLLRTGVVARLRRGLTPLTFTALAVALIVALPLLSLAASLTQTGTGSLQHLSRTVLPAAVLNTIGLILLVGSGTAFVGVITAWLVTAFRFPGSRHLEWLLLLPMAMPAYIIGYVYTDALAFVGPVQSALRAWFGWSKADYWFPDIHNLGGVSLMLTLVLYPYVYMLARSAFIEQSACTMDASRTLGGSMSESFWRIALPLARPAVAAGVALVLMEALADFGTVEYFGIHTFTTVIYRTWFGMGDRIAAAQLSIGLLCFVFVLAALERQARGSRRFARTSRRERILGARPLRGVTATAALAACALPVLLGFAVPAFLLVRLHLSGGDPLFGARFAQYATNSFMLAGMAAVIVVAAGALLAYALRVSASPLTRLAVRFATLGYAIPGTVVAVGILLPLGLFDNTLDRFMRGSFGISTGLLFSGTLVALMFAYLVRFLAIATGGIEAGYARIGMNVDYAARTLGSTQGALAGRIHAPMLRRSLLTAGLVVFVDVMKELPATLIVRPFNLDTLAIRAYQLASDERLAQSSTAALAIVVIGILPVLLLTSAMRQRH
ncbi:MAG: iron ABC transporter permease [Hyphomicrobiales bacterium]|nr:iron ABC transporter permease [Hyphomicrobiales bacterium]